MTLQKSQKKGSVLEVVWISDVNQDSKSKCCQGQDNKSNDNSIFRSQIVFDCSIDRREYELSNRENGNNEGSIGVFKYIVNAGLPVNLPGLLIDHGWHDDLHIQNHHVANRESCKNSNQDSSFDLR